MRVLVVLSAVLAVASAVKICGNKINLACSLADNKNLTPEDVSNNCDSMYGLADDLKVHLRQYAQYQIEVSFHYMLLSSWYGTYKVNREGFQSYYRKLSDRAWEDAIDLIKFITKRGGHMEFNSGNKMSAIQNDWSEVFELTEVQSMAKALDMQKILAEKALHIHGQALVHKMKIKGDATSKIVDGSVAHYFEERFIEPQADRVRTMAGHVNDLRQLLSIDNPSISLFVFDEYLKKSL